MRESKALQADEFKPTAVKITDAEELGEYRLKKRKEFEDQVRRVGRWNGAAWVKYAQWEESQLDFRRARSVWERALECDHRNVSIWLRYAEMEMKHTFVNHARNVWDRAVSLLPRIDQLWYKYIHMEEMLGNVPGARQLFERWMAWEPDHHGWTAYIKFELRYGETDRARLIYERYIKCLPSVEAWVRYAKFELKNGKVSKARQCYERSVEELGGDQQTEELYIRFAEFEAMVGEPERARAIYKFALNSLPRSQAEELQRHYIAFEKQQGDRDGIDDVIISERRQRYEEQVVENPHNYDVWFDYLRLEESCGSIEGARETYERAVSAVPLAAEKRYWQRYIYLWIKYALFEELISKDKERTREVFRAALKLIPHSEFTFAKVWIMAAKFEIRQLRLDGARKILGLSIGMCPKNKLFKYYIDMEMQLGNMDRCRTLYEKYLEWNPSNVVAWCRFAELENTLGETERTRAIYELAINRPELDMPEALWKAFIDFEIAEGNRENGRGLYERLLERTQHVKVWLSYARFEATPLAALVAEEKNGEILSVDSLLEDGEDASEREERARKVYERAFRALRDSQPDAKEEAVLLLEAWREFEKAAAISGDVSAVEAKMPRRVKRKRAIESGGFEEYYDYVFPSEGGAAPNLKILEAAYKWKKQKMSIE